MESPQRPKKGNRDRTAAAPHSALKDDPASIMAALLPEAAHEETHLSHLFLTQDTVFKLKKAIALPFADFTSLEKRHAACQQEIRVNRPFCADLYLGVVPLVRRGTRYAIDGKGTPVDWLVRMRRFGPDDRGDRALETGRLTDRHLRDFTDDLYARHEATTTVVDPHWPARLGRTAQGVISSIQESTREPEILSRLHSFANRFEERLQAARPFLEARGRTATLSSCHGDLHLKNLCLWEGRLRAYDALEFDDELVRIDRLYDLAFLVADLWHRGHESAANAVMNRYFGLTGTSDGVRVMPLYSSLRCVIRGMAHVLSGSTHEAAECLATAYHFLEPRGDPVCVLISGRSGTGKTTLARRLAPCLGGPPGAVHIRSDVVRKCAAGFPPEAPMPAGSYAPQERRAVYETCRREAAGLRGIWSVILDIAFARGDDDDAAILSVNDVPDLRLWLDAPDEVLRARLDARTADASDANTGVMLSQRRTPPSSAWTVIDAGGSPEAMLAQTLEILSHRHGLPFGDPDYDPVHEV